MDSKRVWKVANDDDDDITTEVGSEFYSINGRRREAVAICVDSRLWYNKFPIIGVARWLSSRASDLRSKGRGRRFEPRPWRCCATTLGKLFTPHCLIHAILHEEDYYYSHYYSLLFALEDCELLITSKIKSPVTGLSVPSRFCPPSAVPCQKGQFSVQPILSCFKRPHNGAAACFLRTLIWRLVLIHDYITGKHFVTTDNSISIWKITAVVVTDIHHS